ncbi:DUF1292 domain-containing protein [bacterium]|nr:DUF1292 domain-containing protein [bacterium]
MAIDEENIIEMTDEDGNVVRCELFDIVEFEGKQYALLLEADSEEEEPEVVLMRYTEDGDDVFFETIDDDKEFDNVQNYIESLEDEFEEEE